MSIELHVLLREARLPGVLQWQAAVDALGFDVRLDQSVVVESNTGFLPAKKTGKTVALSSMFRPPLIFWRPIPITPTHSEGPSDRGTSAGEAT